MTTREPRFGAHCELTSPLISCSGTQHRVRHILCPLSVCRACMRRRQCGGCPPLQSAEKRSDASAPFGRSAGTPPSSMSKSKILARGACTGPRSSTAGPSISLRYACVSESAGPCCSSAVHSRRSSQCCLCLALSAPCTGERLLVRRRDFRHARCQRLFHLQRGRARLDEIPGPLQ